MYTQCVQVFAGALRLLIDEGRYAKMRDAVSGVCLLHLYNRVLYVLNATCNFILFHQSGACAACVAAKLGLPLSEIMALIEATDLDMIDNAVEVITQRIVCLCSCLRAGRKFLLIILYLTADEGVRGAALTGPGWTHRRSSPPAR